MNFCRLFWGVLLSPFTVILMGLVTGVGKIVEFVKGHRRSVDLEEAKAKSEARRAKGYPRIARVVTFIGGLVEHLSAFFQNRPWIAEIDRLERRRGDVDA